jgi:homopolymeric O-antigen transport system permease protein
LSKASVVIPEQRELPPATGSHEELHPASGEWLSELWRYRELLYFLAWRDVKIRYKQAVLGAAWAVIQPLFAMIIFTFFFGRLAQMPSNGVPYPLFCYCALVPWTYFSVTLGQAGNSLLSNANLITKVYFPRVLLPAAASLSGLLDFGIGSAFLVVLMVYYKIRPGWTLVLWPLAVIGMVIVTLGVSMLFAGLNVRYRDVKYAIPFLIQLGLFVTPVIYPVSFLPERVRPLLALNPLSGIIEIFRASLFPQQGLDLRLVVISVGITLLLFAGGAVYFWRSERTFADII